jgi:hypothetical protein
VAELASPSPLTLGCTTQSPRLAALFAMALASVAVTLAGEPLADLD